MQQLPDALRPLAEYRQFILCKYVPSQKEPGKFEKYPVDHRTLQVFAKGSDWQNDPTAWTSADEAIRLAGLCGDTYGIGFFFTAADPFFFLDIDRCLQPDNTWSPLAQQLLGYCQGAAVSVSSSGRGLHVFGRVPADIPHGSRNDQLGLELYTEKRFVALSSNGAQGSADTVCDWFPQLVANYFQKSAARSGVDEWTEEPVDGYTGPEDDDELIERACASRSAAGAFGQGASFLQLWEGDEEALARSYPDGSGHNGSQADAALAQHLAFWTGNDCERILRLMWRSGLVRDKWEREDYLHRTILNAVGMQETVFSTRPDADTTTVDEYGAARLKASSDAQRQFAESIRAERFAEFKAAGLPGDMLQALAQQTDPKLWLDHRDKSGEQLAAMITPVSQAAPPKLSDSLAPEVREGFQYLGATQQIDYFSGCVYVQSLHKVFTPDGALLKSEQFNATYGGYTFQMDSSGGKTTRKAWDAFTESQLVRYPKAAATCFRPDVEPGAIIYEEGDALVNTYKPVATPRVKGDPTPFLKHVEKILPDPGDRAIILAYMAACIQHKGVKFQWAPLLQGAEGNGKTLLTRCVAFAVGQRYTHQPPANEISEKFNEWLFNKLFIGIEDVYVPEHKREIIEILKPMITNDRLAMRAMQQSQVMGDNRANFMLNSNHKDAIRKTRTDRRFSVFYTAQQTEQDLVRDGMNGTYFPALYDWLKGRNEYAALGENHGYAVVADYLAEYAIPDELNPATRCHRAPQTSTTEEAISQSMGGVEQEILEAVAEDRPGFAGGWISSVAVERLLQSIRAARSIPHNKRRELLQSLGYDYHPALRDGRTNINIPLDDNKKPRLFIRDGHIHANITSANEAARLYQEAQGAIQAAGSDAERRFNT
jgi:hypothetical protein